MGVGATTMPGVPRLARALSKVPSAHSTEHAVSTCLSACYSFRMPTPLVSTPQGNTMIADYTADVAVASAGYVMLLCEKPCPG